MRLVYVSTSISASAIKVTNNHECDTLNTMKKKGAAKSKKSNVFEPTVVGLLVAVVAVVSIVIFALFAVSGF